MLLSRKTWTLLDLVIMCLLSRFLYLTRSIYFTGLSDDVSVYVHGQYTHLSLDTLNLHVYLSILYNLYDSMIVWWVLIRGFSDPRLSLYVQVLLMYSLYNIHVCVSTLSCGSIMFQTWSDHFEISLSRTFVT